jgi:hypothetical protein
MARNYSPLPQEGYRQLEMCFDQPAPPADPALPPQERNARLEDILRNHSTLPDFLRDARQFLDYPHPQRVTEILFNYFPGQFGRRQVLDDSDLLKLQKIIKNVYSTYSHYIQFLEGSIPYSLDDTYLGENTAEKGRLMAAHLGKRVQSKMAKFEERYDDSSEYESHIGELFREQVLHYQRLITQGNRRK